MSAPPGRHHDQDMDRPREADQAVVIGVRHVRLPAAAVIVDRDAEALEPARDRPADPAESEDADPPPAQRRRERERRLRPMARAQVAVRLGDPPQGRQHEADREVGDLVGEHVRRVGDDDAAPVRRDGIDGVVADAEIRDEFEVRQPVHQRSVDTDLTADAEPADPRTDLGQQRLRIRGAREPVNRVPSLEGPFDERMHLPKQQDLGRGLSHRSLPRSAARVRPPFPAPA